MSPGGSWSWSQAFPCLPSKNSFYRESWFLQFWSLLQPLPKNWKKNILNKIAETLCYLLSLSDWKSFSFANSYSIKNKFQLKGVINELRADGVLVANSKFSISVSEIKFNMSSLKASHSFNLINFNHFSSFCFLIWNFIFMFRAVQITDFIF